MEEKMPYIALNTSLEISETQKELDLFDNHIKPLDFQSL